jgi:hypothetical protein
VTTINDLLDFNFTGCRQDIAYIRRNKNLRPGFPSQGKALFQIVICVVLFVIRVVLLLIVMLYVLFMCKCVLPPGVNPIAVDKHTNIKKFV